MMPLAMFVSSLRTPTRTARGEIFIQEPARLCGEPMLHDQIWPALPRAHDGLLQPPACDVGMVARHQHLRNAAALEHFRPCVVRPVEQTCSERFLLARALI